MQICKQTIYNKLYKIRTHMTKDNTVLETNSLNWTLLHFQLRVKVRYVNHVKLTILMKQ